MPRFFSRDRAPQEPSPDLDPREPSRNAVGPPPAEATRPETQSPMHTTPGELAVETSQARGSVVSLVTALIARLQEDASQAVRNAEETATQGLLTVADAVAALRRSFADYQVQRNETDQQLLAQLADFKAEQRQLRAAVDGLGGAIGDAQLANAREPAVRALIAVDEQLGNVLSAVSDENRKVIAGQRENVRQTLGQLGVRSIEPDPGTRVDPNRHRSSAAPQPTADPDRHEQIASVNRPGWELGNGHLLSPAEVVVYVYNATASSPVESRQDDLAAALAPVGNTRAAPPERVNREANIRDQFRQDSAPCDPKPRATRARPATDGEVDA